MSHCVEALEKEVDKLDERLSRNQKEIADTRERLSKTREDVSKLMALQDRDDKGQPAKQWAWNTILTAIAVITAIAAAVIAWKK